MKKIICGEHTFISVSNLKLNKRNICGTCKKMRKSEQEPLYKREQGWNGIYICANCLSKKKSMLVNKEKEEKKKEEVKKEERKKEKWDFSKFVDRPLRAPSKQQIEIPNHLQWAARHPFQGGGFSGK